MATTLRQVLKAYFESGDEPTQAQFEALLDSIYMPEEDGAILSASGGELDASIRRTRSEIINDPALSIKYKKGQEVIEPDGVKYRTKVDNPSSEGDFELADEMAQVTDSKITDDTPIWQAGNFLKSDGSLGGSSDYSYTTNFLRVTPGSTRIYNGSGTTTVFMCFYDINKNFKGSLNIPSVAMYRSYVIPENVYYVRLSNRHATITNDKLNFYDAANLKQSVNRAIDGVKAMDKFIFTPIVWTAGSFVTTTGALTGHSDFSYTNYLEVVEGSTMKFHGVGSSGGLVGIAFYDANKMYLLNSFVEVTLTAEGDLSVTVPPLAKYTRASNRHSVLSNSSAYFEVESSQGKEVLQNTTERPLSIATRDRLIYDELVWTGGGFINSVGTVTPHNDFSYSGYVSVIAGATRKFNGVGSGGTVFIAFYNASYTHISGFAVLATSETVVDVLIPAGAVYAKCSNRHTVLANANVYFETPDNVRKELLSTKKASLNSKASLLKIDLTWPEIGFIGNEGQEVGGSAYSRTGFLPIVGGVDYLFNGVGASANVYVAFYGNTQTFISSVIVLSTGVANGVVSSPENAAYVRLSNRTDTLPNDNVIFETATDAANNIERLKAKIAVLEATGTAEAFAALEWEKEQALKKNIELQKLNEFEWKDRDAAYVSFIMDDLGSDTGLIYDILKEYGFPMCFAAIESNFTLDLGDGRTSLDVVREAIKRGGEVLSHDSAGIDGGTKAIQAFEITAGATSDGVIEFTLNDKVIQLEVANGDTANDIAVALAALEAEEWSSSIASNTVTFTRNFGGTVSASAFADPNGTDVTATVTSTEIGAFGDDEDAYIKAFITNKKAFESYGFEINGVIMAGVTGYDTVDLRKTEEYCRKYFKYSDKFGTIGNQQFRFTRSRSDVLATMIGYVDAAITAKSHLVLYTHNLTQTPEATLRGTFDYIKTKIGTGEIGGFVTLKKHYDLFASTVLENRIKALEP